jgi:hypothetical protein
MKIDAFGLYLVIGSLLNYTFIAVTAFINQVIDFYDHTRANVTGKTKTNDQQKR